MLRPPARRGPAVGASVRLGREHKLKPRRRRVGLHPPVRRFSSSTGVVTLLPVFRPAQF